MPDEIIIFSCSPPSFRCATYLLSFFFRISATTFLYCFATPFFFFFFFAPRLPLLPRAFLHCFATSFFPRLNFYLLRDFFVSGLFFIFPFLITVLLHDFFLSFRDVATYFFWWQGWRGGRLRSKLENVVKVIVLF